MNDPNDNGEPFLSRWSRRKREAGLRQPESSEPRLPAGETATTGEWAESSATSSDGRAAEDESELDLSKLPQVEDLTVDSDISVFLDRRVPAALRNAALGRMWTLDPTIRDFIEVAENQWNWNVPGGAPFYEPIEAGSGIGEMVAKATNAAARPDMPPQPAGLDNTGTPGSAAPEASQGIDSSTQPSPDCREHSQSEIAANPDAAPSSSLEETAASDATFEHIAAQHNDAPPQSKPQSLPRRHGSALPS